MALQIFLITTNVDKLLPKTLRGPRRRVRGDGSSQTTRATLKVLQGEYNETELTDILRSNTTK